MSKPKLQVFDSPAMPWEERFIPELGKAGESKTCSFGLDIFGAPRD